MARPIRTPTSRPTEALWWGLLGALAVMGVINVPLQAVATMFLVRATGQCLGHRGRSP